MIKGISLASAWNLLKDESVSVLLISLFHVMCIRVFSGQTMSYLPFFLLIVAERQ